MERRLAKHGGPDSHNVNINFKLYQAQNKSLVANPKIKDLDITLDNPASYVDEFL